MPFYYIKAITSLQDLASLREFWEENQWHPNADFEFFHLIVRIRPHVISPCVFAAFVDDKVVSLLAGRIEYSHLSARMGYTSIAKFRTRQLVIIDGALMGNQDDGIWTGMLTFIDCFMLQEKIDLTLFEQVKIDSPVHRLARQILGHNRLREARDISKHWLMRLPKTWEEFLRSRSKKHRYWLKRLENILNTEFSGKWEMRAYTSPAEAMVFADAAETVAKSTYHRALNVGFIRNAESSNRLDLEARHNRLRGYVLFLEGAPKAFWHCTVHKQALHLCSTGYDPALRSYELGTVLLMKVFQDHCEKGGSLVDFGLGEAGYKQRFGSDHYMETSLLLFANSARGLGLNAVHSVARGTTKAVKKALDRFNATQRLKTLWRRKLEKIPPNL